MAELQGGRMNNEIIPIGKGRKAVCLLSGGLDSTTCLYVALRDGYEVTALTVHYGQLHDKEIKAAKKIAEQAGVTHMIVPLSMPWGGSALTDENIEVPMDRSEQDMGSDIPSTYVPARNTLFLSLASSLAETIGASKIFIGANAIDYSGYPDCRPEYLNSFQQTIKLGTKAGNDGHVLSIEAPLLSLTKKVIVQLGDLLQVPFELTWTCYKGEEHPCQRCDACQLRAKGFEEAKVKDPLLLNAAPTYS